MMKLSFMTFATPDWDLNKILTGAIRYGYDAVEPRAEANHKHGVELEATKKQRKELKAAFNDTGIALCCIATSRTYAMAEADKRAESVELTKRYIDLAHDTGAPTIRVFGGGTPQGADFADVKKYVAEALRECAEYAKSSGVYVCMETHDGYINANDAVEVVRNADSPMAAINWDIMHPCTAGMTIAEAFEVVKPYVKHCHAHDGTRKEGGGWDLVPMGTGEIDHAEAIRYLASINYDGAFSGEWIAWQPAEELLPREAAVMREYRAAAYGS
ncbi:MAG: sugar phosphate isomerase/epimerase family protein [Armatimonadia bacterium]